MKLILVRGKRTIVLTATQPPRPGTTRRRVLVLMCLWTVFVAFALWWLLRPAAPDGGPWVMHRGEVIAQPYAERVRDWFRLLDLNFQRIYPWVLLGPYVGWLAWHCSLERGRLRLSLPVHLGACAVFVLASYAINMRSSLRVARVVIITSHHDETVPSGKSTNQVQVEISERSAGGIGGSVLGGGLFAQRSNGQPVPDALGWNPNAPSGAGFTNFFLKSGGGFEPPMGTPDLPSMQPLTTLLDLLAYGAMVGLVHSVHFYRRYREREHRNLFLESNLAKARLGALQAQLHPHFLFNSLNAVVALLRRDPKQAEATLTSLSDLLRLTLSQSAKQEVPLREELSFVERYMEIQQTRFGDRLRFEQDVEPAALDCLVPTLLLQPLVENALRHGIEPAENAGLVRLRVYRTDKHLVLTVEDDGVGLGDGSWDLASQGAALEVAKLPGGIDAASPPRSAPVSGAASWVQSEGSQANASVAEAQPGGCARGRAHSDEERRPASSVRSGSKAGTGIGLANLRARLEALYADRQKLELSSRQPQGVTVRIEIPCLPEGAAGEPESVKTV